MGCAAGVRGCHLTIRSSRDRFAASAWRRRLCHRRGRKSVRLNSGVRPARAKPAIARQSTGSSGNLHHATAIARSVGEKLTCIELQTAFSLAPRSRSRSTARKRWQSKSKRHTSDGLPDFVLQIGCQACALRSSEQEHRPNNSFKPSPLRGLGAT